MSGMRQGPIGPSLAPNPRLSVTGMSMPFLFLGYLLDVFLPAVVSNRYVDAISIFGIFT